MAEALATTKANPKDQIDEQGTYEPLAPKIAKHLAPADRIQVSENAFRVPGYVLEVEQVHLFRDARTGATEIPITYSGFKILKELKKDPADNVMKIFLSKTPAAVTGEVYWLDGAGKLQQLDIIYVAPGENSPNKPFGIKVTKTGTEVWNP